MIKKLHFFRLEKRKGTNFLFSFTRNRYSLKVKEKKNRFIPPLVAWDKLSKNIEDHFASPFLLVKRFHSYQKATSIVFNFFSLFSFSFNTFAVKATSIFSRINLQIIVNVVREPVKKNCQKFPQFLFFGFSLYQMDAWLIIPLMIIVHH